MEINRFTINSVTSAFATGKTAEIFNKFGIKVDANKNDADHNL